MTLVIHLNHMVVLITSGYVIGVGLRLGQQSRVMTQIMMVLFVPLFYQGLLYFCSCIMDPFGDDEVDWCLGQYHNRLSSNLTKLYLAANRQLGGKRGVPLAVLSGGDSSPSKKRTPDQA